MLLNDIKEFMRKTNDRLARIDSHLEKLSDLPHEVTMMSSALVELRWTLDEHAEPAIEDRKGE